jgi:predicted phage baseplate assembly protein
MALPAPDLDDRRFQQLVDDAKRMVMARCPTWTDHNVSDPGVTLIETFAYMTDVLLYRLNRVPDRLYLKFLELIGLQLFPATSARTGLTFYLSSPAQGTLTLPRGTRAGTLRTETEDPVIFTTVEELPIVACTMQSALTQGASAEGRACRSRPSPPHRPLGTR